MNISRNLKDSFHHKKGVVTRTLAKFRHAQSTEQYNIEKRHIDAWKKGWTNETSTHYDGNGLQTVAVVVIVVVFLPLRLTVYKFQSPIFETLTLILGINTLSLSQRHDLVICK